MKPGDHPEFFRFPAPEGRSRESTIVLDERGRFHHEGVPIENARIARAFASWMAIHPDDGRYILTNGYDWTYLTVRGAPLFVEGITERDGAILLVLSNAREIPIEEGIFRSDSEGALTFVPKDAERLFARFLPSAQLRFGELLIEEDGILGVRSAGHFVPVAEVYSGQLRRSEL